MIKVWSAAAAAAALLVTVTACSTGAVRTEDHVITPAAAATSSRAVIALPDAMSMAAARAQYLRLVRQGNADLSYYSYVDGNDQNLADWVAMCSTIAGDDQDLAGALTNATWPHPVQGPISALAVVLQADAQLYEQCATSQDLVSAQDAVDDVPDHTAQANAVRSILGLPQISN